MNRSHSNSFNFDNELELSQTKKDKTGQHFFTKEFYGFQDFMNANQDRTMKSQKYDASKIINMSEIDRRQIYESNLNANAGNLNIIDFLTENSIKTKSIAINKSINDALPDHLSPKFADQIKKNQEINQFQFTLRRKINQLNYKTSNFQQKGLPGYGSKDYDSNFKKKVKIQIEQPLVITKQLQYQDLTSKIRFYEQSMERLVYQSSKLSESSDELFYNMNGVAFEEQMKNQMNEIRRINKEIEDERNLEGQLIKMQEELEEESEDMINWMKTMEFKRPHILKDQTKVIIDEINLLKGEFFTLQRDNGSLNLSATLLNTQSLINNPYSNRQIQPKNSHIQNQLHVNALSAIFQEISEENKKSQDPKFLYNLKMACLRDEWTIYINSEIQINVSYRSPPKIRIHIGNKDLQDLLKFTIKEAEKAKIEGEILKAKSYVIYEMSSTPESIHKLFVKLQICYEKEQKCHRITLYVPSGITNFGQFSPITQKQFRSDGLMVSTDQFCSSFKPMDKSIIEDIKECCLYMPNLISDKNTNQCYGLFISGYNQHNLIVIRQKNQLISVISKNQGCHLVKMLEFIYTI